jgi:hypothetical protein
VSSYENVLLELFSIIKSNLSYLSFSVFYLVMGRENYAACL